MLNIQGWTSWKVGGRRLCFTFVSIHKHSAGTFQSLFLPSSVPTEVTQFYQRFRKELRVEARSRSPHVSQVTDLWFRESWESREPNWYNFIPNPHARTPRELTCLLILSLRQGECCTELKLTTWKIINYNPFNIFSQSGILSSASTSSTAVKLHSEGVYLHTNNNA